MNALDLLDHLLNLFAPALGMALLAPTLARLVWWRALQATWLHQVKWVAVCNAVVVLIGLVALGRDGAMATYAALVLSSAVVIWWTGLR